MTLTTETEAEAVAHDVGYYVVFEGVATRIATEDPGGGGTYLAGMSMPSTSSQTLDRRQGVVRPGGFSVSVQETTDNDFGSLFARRGGTEAPLAAGLSNSSTTVQVVAQDWANGSTVYIGRETITLGTYTSSPSPRYTGCTRAAQGSVAVEHQKGRTISSRPRHWKGRFATLYEFVRSTGTAAAVRTGQLDGSPSWNRGVWSLDFLDLTTALNRPICSGWDEEQVEDIDFADDNTATVEVVDAALFTTGWVRITTEDDQVFHHRVTATDTGSDTLTITTAEWVRSDDINVLRDVHNIKGTVRQIGVGLKEDPARMALRLMLSRYGDGTNDATYDDLSGIPPDTGDGLQAARRMGAALPASYVDVDAWEALIGVASRATFVLDEQMHLIDFLAREIAWRLGGFVYVTTEGKLSFKRYLPGAVDAALTVYDEGDLASADISYVDDEEEIMSGVVVESNWDYEAREYRHRTEIIFPETQDVYGEERDLYRISSRSLRVGATSSHPLASPPVGESDVAVDILRGYARSYLGLRRVRFALRWQWHLRFHVGYRFKLTLSNVPNGNGGLGFTAAIAEVVSMDVQTDVGRVVVEADIVPTGKIIAPRCEVSSVSGTTIGLLNDALLLAYPATLKVWPVGCTVRFYDASASPPFSVYEDQVVQTNPSVGSITVDAAPSTFTLAVGDHAKLVWGSGDTGNTNDLGADVSDHAILADTNDEVDGDRDNAGRWA